MKNLCASATTYYITEALIEDDYSKIADHWTNHSGSGQYELVLWVAELAEIATYHIFEVLKPEDYPGVFDYEVSTAFGRKLRGAIIDSGEWPSDFNVRTELTNMINGWFKYGTIR